MTEALKFLWLALQTYRIAKKNGNAYYGVLSGFGVPKVALFVGVDREAWRVTQVAIEAKLLK